MSAVFVTLGVWAFAFLPEVAVKVIVDTILFFVSYRIQNQFIFK